VRRGRSSVLRRFAETIPERAFKDPKCPVFIRSIVLNILIPRKTNATFIKAFSMGKAQ
jgi:hypothetical protein